MTHLFTSFADEDPVWLFPLAHPIKVEVEDPLLARLNAFLPTWKTHGRPVRAEVTCVEQRVIAVVGHVRGGVSGCGQDALRHEVESACEALHVELAPPLSIWVSESPATWTLFTRAALKKALHTGSVSANAHLVDSTVRTVAALNAGMIVPLVQSWAHVLLPPPIPVS